MDIAFVKQKSVAFGGGEGYLTGLMERCRAMGATVHLLTAKWTGEDRGEIKIHRIPMQKYSRKARGVSFSKGVQACLQRNRFDAVLSLERTIGQDVWRGGEGVHRVWLNMRKQYESALKTLMVESSSFQRAVLQIEKECIQSTPYLIANSDMVKRDILNTFPEVDEEKISVIYNGVDPSRFNARGREEDRSKIRRELDLQDSDKFLLLAGSGFRRKGVLETMQVLREFPDCKLVIMGRDDSKPWRRATEKLGVANRVFFHAPQKNIEDYYRAADVALVPSWYDPFPNVGIEALACGTPVVTTQATGTCDLIQPGVNGQVFSEPGNLEDFSQAVKKALMINGGQAVADPTLEFTSERNANQTMELLMKAASH